MLATITYNYDDITPGNWAQWWQIYFEQPAVVKDKRVTVAETIARELGVV